ncbi:Diheme cytochrome c SoxD [Sulfitobacter noctilucae]|uniref:c-type cytochrome n=1 Tax=Sulfitobacter noctilucae TaxID=1342302 RepID=UPI000468B922|nr:c-type cytochrome [Sulfitobacter noctilucae]KIN61057.1 Diheme cytochrome c SoxD [Sulfitobacter noctilucae]
MLKFLKVTTALTLLSAPAYAETFGLGRAALPEEIAAWDLDVSPNGTGLPEGSGDVLTGEEVFADQCASCHGDFAEGVDNWPKLAGGWDTLADKDPLKTVGSYWPHLSTTWDYVNRSMPFGNAQSLEPDEVYAIVAYILYSNDLVDDDFVLSQETFASFELPNQDGFIVDDRIETEFSKWVGEPCMTDCKDSVEVTMRAMVLDVTPQEETAGAEAVLKDEEVLVASTEPQTETPAEAPEAETVAAADPALIAEGEKVFRKCKSCHQIGEGAKNRSGPILTGIVGHAAGAVDGFKYSKALKNMADDGLVWDEKNLAAFLAKPKGFMKGTRMSFAGLKKEDDIAAVTAYLSSFGD